MSYRTATGWYRRLKIPRALIIAACLLPVAITALFYILRPQRDVMDWAAARISAPVRGFIGMLSSLYPFSMMEALCAAAALWLVYYIVKTIMAISRRRGKLRILSRRVLPVLVAALYVYGMFCWLWSIGYHATGFSEKCGFEGGGVSVEELASVTRMFAAGANELAPLMDRDEGGRYVGDRDAVFAASTGIYANTFAAFPALEGKLYAPKPMIFSWLMSRTGYTGIYFALTGESNVNTRMPDYEMPVTVAHELAHQRGVFAEDEASFVGIAACIASGDPVFEYAGYCSGLAYLINALWGADPDAAAEINDGFCDELNRDRADSFAYWNSQRKVETGNDFFDKVLTAVTTTVSDAVDSAYDGFLKSQNQELGLRSYGACVDLLVEYYR